MEPSFVTQISRELGSIESKLDHIDKQLDRMEEELNDVKKAITILKIKAASISAAVSIVVGGLSFLVKLKGL